MQYSEEVKPMILIINRANKDLIEEKYKIKDNEVPIVIINGQIV